MRATVLMSSVLCLGAFGCANSVPDQDIQIPELPSNAYTENEIDAMDADLNWLDQATAHNLGSYTVHTPSDDSNRLLVVGFGAPTISILSRSVTIRDDQDRILVQLDDRDRNGVYESLSYAGYDPTTGSTVMVVDRDFDGQADSKQRLGGDEERWLWYAGAWRQVSISDGTGHNLLLVDGDWRRYEVVEGEVRLLEE